MRQQGQRAEQAKRHDERRPRVVVGVVRRRRPADRADAGRDGEHSGDLPPPDPLVQPAGADHEQEDEPGRERGLDERERRERQRDCLERPSGDVEHDSQQPARPPDQEAQ